MLLTDVEMPGALDGFALAGHVAEHWPHIEIVVSSGRLKPKDGDLPSKAVFIMKPSPPTSFSANSVGSYQTKKSGAVADRCQGRPDDSEEV